MEGTQQNTAQGTGLMNANNPFQAQGSSYFNQNPRQLSGVVLYQGTLVGATWTNVISVPRGGYLTIQDIWAYNRNIGTAFDGFLAFVGASSTFDPAGGTDQDDVFQYCDTVAIWYRDEKANIAINPKQAVWAYCTQPANLKLSGLQVTP